jgi:hypothetical protein
MFKHGDKVMRIIPHCSDVERFSLDTSTVYTVEYCNPPHMYLKDKGDKYSYAYHRFFKVKEQLAPWYPANVKPSRVGWYDTNNPFHTSRCIESEYRWWWDGEYWTAGPGGNRSANQNRMWRGITYVKDE